MPDTPRFSRRSVVAACNLLANRIQTHAEFDREMIRIGAETLLTGRSIQEKANSIARTLIAIPDHRNWEDEFIADEVVHLAASLPFAFEEDEFVRALMRDGYTVTEEGMLRAMLPGLADIRAADDEVHALMNELGLTVALRHLDNAIDLHGRGRWEAANGELRKVFENLFDEAAEKLDPTSAAATQKGHNRRQMLAGLNPPFLIEELGEWSHDGKNLVNGIFKRLHHGGHAGLSGDEDCTFRLHVVLLAARLFLRRLKARV